MELETEVRKDDFLIYEKLQTIFYARSLLFVCFGYQLLQKQSYRQPYARRFSHK